MKTPVASRKFFMFILAAILIGFGVQSGYAQTITAASVPQPLTEANLHGSIVTLTLTGGTYEQFFFDVVTVSGIDGVTFESWNVDRVSNTQVTVELEFYGNIDTDGTLTFTVGADAIAGYTGNALTATLPVTAIQESLVALTEFPLTEATLNGSVVTLTLSGRTYEQWIFEDLVTVSGIDGVTVEEYIGVERVSDTEVRVKLTFDGDFDTDATLTFTVGVDAIAGYYQDFTAEIPVTAIEKSDATVNILPASVVSPDVGEELTFSINITGGENVTGYQVTVSFDSTTLQPIVSFDSEDRITSDSNLFSASFTNGDYLPAGAFFADPIVVDDWLGDTFFGEAIWSAKVILAANTLAGAANGDGTLATLTFKVVDFKPSTVTLSQVYLVDSNGKRWEAATENAEVTIPPEPEEETVGDINRDDVVDILDLTIVGARFGQRGQNSADLNGDGFVDIVDLVLVAAAFSDEAQAPSLYPQALVLNAADVRQWLSQAQQLALTDPAYLRGITVLEQLHAALIPQETTLLPNYPNPFNPETWIPYRLAKDAFVTLTICDQSGQVVRTLDVGHQIAGYYTDRTKAAYWDGKNEFGEGVASGVYFYHLSTGRSGLSVPHRSDFSATRKMLILK